MISIIIPTCHRDYLLSKCLDCLQLEAETKKIEIIISDDGWQSSSKDMIEKLYPCVQWVSGPRKGPAANRNNGAKQARGSWLLFLDDDCLPDPGIIANYLEAIAKYPDCKIFEGKIYADRPKRRMDEEAPVNEKGGYLWSCNFAIQKELFWEVGAFDELFPYAAMEDVDLNYRLRKMGNLPVFIPSAAVSHPWRSIKGYEGLLRHFHSQELFVNKHPNEKERIKASRVKWITKRYFANVFHGMLKYRGRGFLNTTSSYFSALFLLLKGDYLGLRNKR